MADRDSWKRSLKLALILNEADKQHFSGRRPPRPDFENIHEAMQKGRELANTHDLEALANRLLDSLYVVEERRAKLATELVQRIQVDNPELKNLAVVLMGSSARGGAEIRAITGNSHDSDLDWAVSFDGKASTRSFSQRVKKIEELGSKLIPELGKKNGLGDDFRSCHEYNPLEYSFTNLKSAQDFLDRLYNSSGYTRDFIQSFLVKHINLFFHPTFPAEVGERNRHFALEALRVLAVQDLPTWEKLTEGMIYYWRKAQPLKNEHFADLSTKRRENPIRNKARGLFGEVSHDAQVLMSEVFEKLILLTKD